MKKVTLTFRINRNWLEQDGRVVTAYHAGPLTDKGGGVVTEVIECDEVCVEEFCVHMHWDVVTDTPSGPHERGTFRRTRAVPLDLLYNIMIEEV